jgi:hypothetical protein
MFGRKRQQKVEVPPELETTLNLTENFSTLCVNKCIRDDIEFDLNS